MLSKNKKLFLIKNNIKCLFLLANKRKKMFSFDLGIIGTAFIAFAVVLRPYILKKIKKEGTVVNVAYFVLLFILAFPLYMLQGKFTLAAIDEATVNELANTIIQEPLLQEFHSVKNAEWVPYDTKRDLYAVKATITKKETPYSIYFLPQCKFLQGCSVTFNDIMILPDAYKEIPLNYIDEQLFETRDCNDEIIKNFWVKKNIDDAFKKLFENYEKVDGTKTTHSIQTLNFSSFVQKEYNSSDPKPQQHTHLLSCKGDFILEGRFSVMKDGKEYASTILPLLFDDVQEHNGSLRITSLLTYNLFHDHANNLIVFSQPFRIEKIKALSR